MTNERSTWHELPGPHAHERGKVLKPRLTPEREAGRFDLFWILVLAAAAATFAGVYLAIRA